MIARVSAILFGALAVRLLLWTEASRPVRIPYEGRQATEIMIERVELQARGTLMMWSGGGCIPLALLFGSLAEMQHRMTRGAAKA